MKKLAVILIVLLTAVRVYNQEHKSHSTDNDKFFARDGVSVDLVTSNDLFKNSYGRCYHFNANGKNYMISYEGGQKISQYLYDGNKVERKIYLYRQDDSINNVWNIASEFISIDYHERIADPKYATDFYDVFFIYTDKGMGSYVRQLKNGIFEICMLRFRYESFKQEDFEAYYVKYRLKPNKDQTYSITKL
jgi:hypothetical protein